MLYRFLLTLCFASFVGISVAEQAVDGKPDVESIRPRDHVTLQLLGELAFEYAKCTRMIPEGRESVELTISTTGVIARKLKNGRFRVEHTSAAVKDGATTRLVTLTAEVSADYFSFSNTPKGTPVFASPGAKANGETPKLTSEDTPEVTVHLAKLKGVKLRVWKLEAELGE